ncbi:exonuclease [Dinoroseobacter phage vB_DshS-R5C]|uniref:Exonuclease n=1 Tax=Dinoroseobacter phage vB_DshS-R5C TaxID=1965368 RepID=A0A1V0DYG2_9CAUD|nr:exonuclease [Dinoroseobacter phage vB_DshS-R5C]ARB06168.1 exonuclease [Dinoroseobacter phage vB_DshS-R5C]
MTYAISLDIETLSTHKNAVVVTIGAITVSNAGIGHEGKIHMALDMQEQIDMGRHVSADTLAWWMQQEPAAQFASFGRRERLPAVVALMNLRSWISELGNPPVWTKGPGFDGAILESLAEDLGVPPSWPYRDHRDIRTIEDAVHATDDDLLYERYVRMIEKSRSGMVAHNALEDAKMQAAVIKWWYEELRNG